MSDFLLSDLPWAGCWPLLLAQAAGDGGGTGFLGAMALPLMATMLLMYFLLMRPESRKRKEMEKMVAALKKNDQVVTIGGIVGTVVQADPQSRYVTIRSDDTTKLKVLRSAIASVGSDESEAKS